MFGGVLQVFDSAVSTQAVPTLIEMGFNIDKPNPWMFRATSSKIQLTIALGRFGSYIQIQLKKLSESSRDEMQMVDLQWVLAVIAPEVGNGSLA